jgi:NitT/TauT family transport system ATP-binding protein
MNATAPHISLRGARKTFGSGRGGVDVLGGIDLDIAPGEFVTLFGPNGAGKTTLLNVLGGIEPLDDGTLEIQSPDGDVRVGYIFQDYRGNLMPWLTVAENIAFPLKIRGLSVRDRMAQVESVKERFAFKVDLNARTYALSGGQAQLTSILRALIIQPHILLMDEPFSALDYQTNLGLYERVLMIWQAAGVTIVLVSHDLDEALYLGQRTVFLTKRPATVAAILENNLSGPKDIRQMGTPQFAALKTRALDVFRHVAFTETP